MSSREPVPSPSLLDTSSPPRAVAVSLGTPLGALTLGGLRGISRVVSKRDEEEEEAPSRSADAWRRLLVRGVTWQNWGGCKLPPPAARPAGLQGVLGVPGGEPLRVQPWSSAGSSPTAGGLRGGSSWGPASPWHPPASLGSSVSTAVTKHSLAVLLSSSPRLLRSRPPALRGRGGLLAPVLGLGPPHLPVPLRGPCPGSSPAHSKVLEARGWGRKAEPLGGHRGREGTEEGRGQPDRAGGSPSPWLFPGSSSPSWDRRVLLRGPASERSSSEQPSVRKDSEHLGPHGAAGSGWGSAPGPPRGAAAAPRKQPQQCPKGGLSPAGGQPWTCSESRRSSTRSRQPRCSARSMARFPSCGEGTLL